MFAWINFRNFEQFCFCSIHTCIVNTAKKETPHSFKGQQLKNKLFYLVVIYIRLLRIILATIYIKLITRNPELAEIHDELSEKRDSKSCTFKILCKIDPPRCRTMAWMDGRHFTYGPYKRDASIHPFVLGKSATFEITFFRQIIVNLSLVINLMSN